MTESRLQLLGACMTWQGAARLGRLELPDGGTRRVVALLGPEGATDEALGRARQAASVALALRGPGILPLLDVVRVEDRIAWVYQEIDALGLGHAVGSEGTALLSTRAAADVVAGTAEILLAAGATAWRHPGPEPTDLLLDAHGRLHLASFVGPFPPAPSMRAPNGDDPASEAAVVYRLGVLLAHLVSGVPTSAPTDRTSHAALVRRALIRAMARPGPVLTERYGDWLRGLLAWEPSERPPLSAVPDGMRKVGEATGGDALVDWAEAHVAWLSSRAAERRVEPERVDPEEVAGDPAARLPTAEITNPRREPPPQREAVDGGSAREEPTEDDPTQEVTGVPEGAEAAPPRRAGRPLEPISIPVAIGPPPEALRRAPRLPSGFLDPRTGEASGRGGSGPIPGPWRRRPATAVAAAVALTAVAAVLLTFILWEGGAEGTTAALTPTLEDVLAGSEVVPRVENHVVVESGAED